MSTAETSKMKDKYEVVISGIGGVFPECQDLEELQHHLNNKTHLITDGEGRWTPGEFNVPSATGKLKTPLAFDLTFFGIHRKLCDIMDPHIRLCMERSFEAICDAGINPSQLSGSNTAVFMASMTSETEYGSVMVVTSSGHGMLGHSRTMQANRISYFFNLTGPSFVMDATWNGGLQGLEIAQEQIANGTISAALVGTSNLMFRPEISVHYDQMGKLNHDGKTKSFADDADGYNRSEGCVVFFLQRAEDARRSYGSILHVMTQNYGSRNVAFTECSISHYIGMLRDCYITQNIDPSEIGFLELDGCAIKNSDQMELDAVDEVLGKKRKTPLLVGSVKSNLGHCEASSSLVSLAKAIIALDSGIIPPNISYSGPNSKAKALNEGRIKVVTEPTPLKGDIVGVSSIGLAGNYGHVVIKRHPKAKLRTPQKAILPPDGLPRLILLSGRDETALKEALKKIESMPIDEEFIALTHKVFGHGVQRHLYRGCTLVGSSFMVDRQVQAHSGGSKCPIWYVFSGMGSQWPGMGTELMRIPIFAKAIHKCQEALHSKGIDLVDIITNQDPTTFDTILHSFVGIAAIQIGLVDVLTAIGIKPDGMVGHSVGELGCAYADGCLTAEQMILSAYARGRASVETKLIKGMMAAVGLGYNQIKNQLPPSIEVACHNASDSCTLSGPAEDMEIYISELKSKGIFAKLVNVSNIAYHSKHIAPAAPALLKYLKEVIPIPKPRSSKWISSSISEENWGTDLAQYSSAEYHTNNLLSSVLFQEASVHIPKDAIVIEIAPHGLLQAILRRSLSTCTNVGLTNRSQKDGLRFFFNAIGKLYLEGLDLEIENIYPAVEFPVSRGTPHIQPIITWSDRDSIDTSESVSKLRLAESSQLVTFLLADGQSEIYSEHKITDQIILPPSYYIDTIIEIFTKLKNDRTFTSPVLMQNLVFNENVEVRPKCPVPFSCQLQQGIGDFEICSAEKIIFSGRITSVDNLAARLEKSPEADDSAEPLFSLNRRDVYKYFERMGVDLGESFRVIKEISFYKKGLYAVVCWNDHWVIFLDALFKLISLYSTHKTNMLHLVHHIGQIIIDPSFYSSEPKEVEVYFDFITEILSCPGLHIKKANTKPYPLQCNPYVQIKYEKQDFVPYRNHKIEIQHKILLACAQIVLENIPNSLDGNLTDIKLIVLAGANSIFEGIRQTLKQQTHAQVEVIFQDDKEILDDFEMKALQDENCLIISGEPISELVTKLMNISKLGFLLCTSQSKVRLPEGVKAPLVFEQTSQYSTISLFKKVPEHQVNSSFIKTSQPEWEANLRFKLKKEVGKGQNAGVIYVLCETTNQFEVNDLLNECASMENNYLLRFVFSDKFAPEFSTSHPFYKTQLELGLKVNIFKDGVWGSYKLLPLQNELECVDTLTKSITHLNKLGSEDVQIKALGLNLPDVTDNGFLEGNKLGVLEYSGMAKTGRPVFGLAKSPESNAFSLDPVLSWTKPQQWSYEQAASIPIAFCTAYYALVVARKAKAGDKVLVHNGMLPISQATIILALDLGCIVFTTYENEEEKREICSKFPKIKKENVLNSSPAQFATTLLQITNGKGVDLIINTYKSREMFLVSTSCIANGGYFFQVNLSVMNHSTYLGMSFFLKETVMHGLTAECLVNLSSNKKKQLHLAIKAGISKGIVQPLTLKQMRTPLTCIDSVNILKSEEMKHKKLVLTVESKNEIHSSEYFICSPDKSYLILGLQDGMWLDITNWLVMRGACNIYVALDKLAMPAHISHCLNSILIQHPALHIQFLTSTHFFTEASAKKMLHNINMQYPIDSTFILDEKNENRISCLDQALREICTKSRFICTGYGGQLCEDRRKSGLHALTLLMNNVSRASNILSKLDGLLCKPDPTTSVVVLNEFNILKDSVLEAGKLSSMRFNHMPQNIDELLELSYEISPKARFVEVPTLFQQYKLSKEVAPLFLIPGLRPKFFDSLAAKLKYPAFKAQLPEMITSIDSVAQDLCEALLSFNIGIFTLVVGDWAGALALSLTKLLEKEGKTVTLVLLDAAPLITKAWATSINDSHFNKLINKYFFLSSKVQQEIQFETNWDDKINILLSKHEFDEEIDEKRLKQSLNAVKNRLDALLNFEPQGKLAGRMFLVRPEGCSESDDCMLQQFSKHPVRVHVTDDSSYEGLLSNEEIVKAINQSGMFEYKDRANPGGNIDRLTNILFDAHHTALTLIRE